MLSVEIRRISASEVIDLRHAILREGLPRESAIFEGDELVETQHFGGFLKDRLCGVVTIFPAPFPPQPAVLPAWQLRGMATTPDVRGAGVGKALLQRCEESVQDTARLLWCNARKAALGFYAHHGWQIVGEEFEIPTAGPHYRMVRFIKSSQTI